MAKPTPKVRPERPTKERTSANLAAGWARVAGKIGRGNFAEQMGIDLATLKRALSGPGLPELHTAFASLLVDPTALDEVATLYGFEIRPTQADAADDYGTIAEMSRLVGQWVEFMADGVRDHSETLQLADTIRDLMPHLSSVLAAADRIKGVLQ